jgi:hypothetical protein
VGRRASGLEPDPSRGTHCEEVEAANNPMIWGIAVFRLLNRCLYQWVVWELDEGREES